jgi:hypothetical protein
VPRKGSTARRLLEKLGADGDRKVYWTGRPGHSNQGHPFGNKLTEIEKDALIEYLKTL